LNQTRRWRESEAIQRTGRALNWIRKSLISFTETEIIFNIKRRENLGRGLKIQSR
jgi:hypothetical protein